MKLGASRISRLAVLMMFGAELFVGTHGARIFSIETAIPLCYSLLTSLLTYVCLKRRLLATAMLVILHSFAYIPGMGISLGRGLEFAGFRIPSEHVISAIATLLLFLGGLALFSIVGDAVFPRRVPQCAQTHSDVNLRVALALVTGVSFATALATGYWSNYGSEVGDRQGGFRFELLYHPLLFSAFLLLAKSVIDSWYRTARIRRWAELTLWPCMIAVVFALFMAQMRRLLAVCALFLILFAIDGARSLPLFGRAGRRSLFGVAALIVMGVLATRGSAAWRESSSAFKTNDVGERLQDTIDRIGQADSTADEIRDRLSYLGMDAATHFLRPTLSGNFTTVDVLSSVLVNASPGLLFPQKYQTEPITCETAFARVAPDTDLPCTPTAEGLLSGGAPVVVLLSVIWSLVLVPINRAFQSRSDLGIVAAASALLPMAIVETSSYPMVYGIRSCIVVIAITFTISLIVRIVRKAFRAPRVAGTFGL